MKTIKNKSERGNALLEFALGWSILWALFAGIYQFGYSFYVYNTVLTSVANAAELGSKMTYDTASPIHLHQCAQEHGGLWEHHGRDHARSCGVWLLLT